METKRDLLLWWFKAIAITVLVLLAMIIADASHEQYEYKYQEVYIINHKYQEDLNALGIKEIEYYDWEETAFSLDIPIDSLTIDIFMKHLKKK